MGVWPEYASAEPSAIVIVGRQWVVIDMLLGAVADKIDVIVGGYINGDVW